MAAPTILIVEDDFAARRLIGFNLKQQGYQVIEAENGTVGYETARTEAPDLILLDIMMPGVNGFEVCKKIRATPHLVETPIIFLTARAGQADKNFALKAGGDDYLTKPINFKKLNHLIESFLQKTGQETPTVKPVGPPGQVVALFSPKEKMGVTTLATKLSAVAAKRRHQPVVLIDLNLPRGDIASLLRLPPGKSVDELLSRPVTQITMDTVEEYMQYHADGFQVIPSPTVPTNPERKPSPATLERVLDLLAARYLVILDLNSNLTELTLTALHHAAKILTITSGQPADNEAYNSFLVTARNLGLETRRLLPVLNQLYGPIEHDVVLTRSPIARVPYMQNESDNMSWTNELAFQKLNAVLHD